jgi:hypothetical protein
MCPGKLAVLDHILVAAPSVVNQNIELALLASDAIKHCRNLFIVRMIAPNRYAAAAKDRGLDSPASHVHFRSRLGQSKSDSVSHTAAPASDECNASS